MSERRRSASVSSGTLDEDSDEDEAKDEGDEVGSAGKAGDGVTQKKERKRKVKVGRQLGVGELVERVENSKPAQTNGA